LLVKPSLGLDILDEIKNIDAMLLPTVINDCGLITDSDGYQRIQSENKSYCK